jgi:hypothetical protein
MYIVISQLVYGPAIETAAVTIKALVSTSTCRTDANDEVDYEEVAGHCNMSSEVGDHKLGDDIARNSIGEAIYVSSSRAVAAVQYCSTPRARF